MCDRIIVLVDMDCFYCQVEARINPSLQGKPMAVVQYNQWKGGGIIAVNYEARSFGVTRHIRGNEAKEKCPDITLVHVPSVRGKADLTRYRDAGREVVEVLCRFSDIVQRASVDEAYLDITQIVNSRWKEMDTDTISPEQLKNTFVVGHCPDDSNDEEKRKLGLTSWLDSLYESELRDETSEKLAVAALIVEEMRDAVYTSTGFRCSAGIAHNKILAKIACGLHKPQRQTVLPQNGVPILYRTLPIKKVRGLGGKFGDIVMKQLGITVMSDLLEYSEAQLCKIFDEKSGLWLFNIAHGFDDEPVTPRLKSKSIGCCKKFPGKLALNTRESVEHWLKELAEEVSERLEKELLESERRATQIIVSYMQTIDGRDTSSSRCASLTSNDAQQIVLDSLELLKKSNTAPPGSMAWTPPLKYLGISAGKFVEKDHKNSSIQNFFKSVSKDLNSSNLAIEVPTEKCENTEKLSETKGTTSAKGGAVLREKKDDNTPESNKNSFFLRFFKQEGLIKTPKSSKKKLNLSNSDIQSSKSKGKSPHASSQIASTSGLNCIPDPSTPSHISKTLLHNAEVNKDQWLSPSEIFPDLDSVDDDVVALLPTPMRQELNTRLQKHHDSEQKNKGIGKGKSKKSLIKCYKEEQKELDNVDDEEMVVCPITEDEDKNDNSETKSSVPSSQDIFASDPCVNENEMKLDVIENVDEITAVEETENKMYINGNNCRISSDTDPNSEYNSGGHQYIESTETLLELCPHCRAVIPLHKYPEHLDFHVASDLDRELNKTNSFQSNRSTTQASTSASTSSKASPKKEPFGKRKRNKVGQKNATPITDKKMRSITAFFAPVQ